ncbi:MAG: hypothetical protein CMI56_00805 [Parcubacteria group bacterium]|nr:hypothetical protein [Parcubacteria group bacterium]
MSSSCDNDSVGLQVLGAFGIIFTVLGYMPQIRRLYVRGTSYDLSLSTMFIWLLSTTLWLIWVSIKYESSDPILLSGYALNCFLMLIILSMTLYYRKYPSNKEYKKNPKKQNPNTIVASFAQTSET